MNHHGRKRTLGGDEETDKEEGNEDAPDVLQNNWVGGSENFQLDLISRREDVQVDTNSKIFLWNSYK